MVFGVPLKEVASQLKFIVVQETLVFASALWLAASAGRDFRAGAIIAAAAPFAAAFKSSLLFISVLYAPQTPRADAW